MEDRKDNPLEENAKLDTNGMCRGRSSILFIEKDDNTSSGLRSTQSDQSTAINPPEENAKLDTNGMCRGKSSIPHIEKDDNISFWLRFMQSELYTEDVSSHLVELSSDDEVQINVKRKSSEKNLQADDQYSSGRTSPEDETCSICLFECTNKARPEKCCRILLTTEI